MPRFNFTNTASEAGKALREHLIQRDQAERQQMLDGLTIQSRLAEQARLENAARRQAEMDRLVAEDRQRRIESEDREIDLSVFAIGDEVPDNIAEKYPQFVTVGRRFKGTVQQREAAAKEAARVSEREADQRQKAMQAADVNANRYMDAELDRNEREAQRAANERIARINVSGRGNGTEAQQLTADLKRLQVEEKQDKLDTARLARTQAATDTQRRTAETIGDIDALLADTEGMARATGAFELRGGSQAAIDWNAKRRRVVAALTLPNLGTLKGPMSDRDVQFVKSIASILDEGRLSEPAVREALTKARQALTGGTNTTSIDPARIPALIAPIRSSR